MNTAKVGTRDTCTHAVCAHLPMEHCEPAHSMLRREPTGVASILATCFENVKQRLHNMNDMRSWLRGKS